MVAFLHESILSAFSLSYVFSPPRPPLHIKVTLDMGHLLDRRACGGRWLSIWLSSLLLLCAYSLGLLRGRNGLRQYKLRFCMK